MARLIACPSCQTHIRTDERICPHCGSRVHSDTGVVARTTSAVLMGLALAGCPADEDDVIEPEYGTPTTMTEGSTSTTEGQTGEGESSSESGDETSTSSSTGGAEGSSTTDAGESDYGVAQTE